MDSEALDRIATLISSRAGVISHVEDRNTLRHAVAGRMKALKLSHPNEYYLLLNSPGAEKEFERLLSLLMVGESYFFRDEGQFAALRDHTLPDIMRRRNGVKTIRIWSAGCATGEEPYSLAILMRETFGELPDWRVSVIGSDLNPDFLAKAEKGLYRPWSFRAMPEPLRQRYFTQRGEQFQLHDSIRRMVTFVQNDLFGGGYPDTARGLYGMDLILCRNVFIYYQPAAVELILGKLAATLAPDGYLLTAHSEISFIPAPGLVAKPLPDTVIYQRAVSGKGEMEATAVPQIAVPREHKAVIHAPAPPAKTPSPTPQPAPLDEARTRTWASLTAPAITSIWPRKPVRLPPSRTSWRRTWRWNRVTC
ncbi:MAG: protein-glutamate O-methyltransferase CheR [Nitrospinae bacterium]|nr:protein-glutamate O-methyltransferase CheR [Nitrospinota bacterium]